MSAHVMKAIVSFYRIDSDTTFERHRNLIPINNDIKAEKSFTKDSTEFSRDKELATKYGLGTLDLKLISNTFQVSWASLFFIKGPKRAKNDSELLTSS